ncbi:GNAT family N-acetyltransferase [Methylocystis parvus]|uniref:GNAT family N-acetyltransferase n=2 Tax=Methylocystis parvus TaxID=134 RepID=A0A6B8M0Q3_9HYPH|nr:GNAT family N-acetyltransferase [Methylocystis parvus]QGM96421.1 GNAT family N-acetyltransferase [Methylocystis parvus]WBJ99733.1 GNAT family N-acetyltransferase [Methylocystis parvus OBBP]
MRPEDLPEICRIATGAHADLPERPEVFEEKARLFPAGCFVLAKDGALVGYAISHPWRLYDIPPLDAFLGALPPSPDCLFLHDVALTPGARGDGATAHLIQRLCNVARKERLAFLALTSVYGTAGFWAETGFQAASDERLAPKLKSYGAGALYMIRKLQG